MSDLGDIIRRGTWQDRLKAAGLFFLLIGGWASIYILSWFLDGR